MPYSIRSSGEDFEVINTETEAVKGTHSPPNAKEKAERQVTILEAVESDPGWDKSE